MSEELPEPLAAPPAEKRMKLRYVGTCRLCGAELPFRTEAVYERATRTVRCLDCNLAAEPAEDTRHAQVDAIEPAQPKPSESGVAGSSARREYERRRTKRDERVRAEHPRLGGLILALSDDPQSTHAWERGAVGEERLGARLDSLASSEIAVLHDRRIPGSKANIDHVTITRSGIWVIDAKRYRGRPELKVEGGLLRPRVERVLVGRRDCTKLVDGVLKQVELVRGVVGELPITGALCFVEADWPLIGGAFTTRGVQVLWPKRLAKQLASEAAGQLDVAAVRELVAARFKPA